VAGGLVEEIDGWSLSVAGWTVTRCFVDPAAFGLLIDGGTGDILRVYIQGRFTLADGEGREQSFGESNDATAFAPLLALMARAVARIFVSRNSELSLAFADGSAIHVAPDPLSEAWELEGLGKLMLICPPGGGSPITFE